MTDNAIKPCPFCGGSKAHVLTKARHSGKSMWWAAWVVCADLDCFAEGPRETNENNATACAGALRRWNERAKGSDA
jgi:hypothetical protein